MENIFNAACLLLLLASCYLLYELFVRVASFFALKQQMKAHGCKLVNSPRNLDPFFGIDFLLERSKHVKNHTWLNYTENHFKSLGLNICQLNMLGNRVLFTIEPKNLETIHQTKFKSWGITPNRRNRVSQFIGEGIFTNDGSHWQQSRRILRRSFERSHIEDITTMERHMQPLIESIPKNGSTVDLRKLFHRFTMNSATDFLLGTSSGAGFTFGDEFEAAFDRILGKIGGTGKMMTLGASKDVEYERDVKFIHDSLDVRIDQALSREKAVSSDTEKKDNFLDHLANETTDRVRIHFELLNKLMAGRDTTASMLTNAWFELAQNSTVWARLRKEVDSLQRARPTVPELQKMQFMRAIFNESMRLYPQLPENACVALEDTILPLGGGGADGKSPIFVSKGQVVIWSSYVSHLKCPGSIFTVATWPQFKAQGAELKSGGSAGRTGRRNGERQENLGDADCYAGTRFESRERAGWVNPPTRAEMARTKASVRRAWEASKANLQPWWHTELPHAMKLLDPTRTGEIEFRNPEVDRARAKILSSCDLYEYRPNGQVNVFLNLLEAIEKERKETLLHHQALIANLEAQLKSTKAKDAPAGTTQHDPLDQGQVVEAPQNDMQFWGRSIANPPNSTAGLTEIWQQEQNINTKIHRSSDSNATDARKALHDPPLSKSTEGLTTTSDDGLVSIAKNDLYV
ncbi:hypothetical protein G7Y89_g10609 [Cudoniella acicularis]|uniref:Cytochrome P450 n=1 Tax=Cudoniella acicularis TaxID=354080 RepID=A0A8H4RER8_9HELO|nr:hypothetical protein G7Y89_g10609 [Cudoniella acicularis]